MGNRISCKRVLAFAFTLVMAVAFIPVLGAGKADAAKPKGRLVKTVTVHKYNDEKGKYELDSKQSFVYNKKKDPTLINTFSYFAGETYKSKTVNSFKYKKGIRKSRIIKLSGDVKGTVRKWSYNKKGLPADYTMKEAGDDILKAVHKKLTYTKSGYIKTYKSKDEYEDETYVEERKYATIVSKGLPKKITESVRYDGKWEKTAVYSFNKKGLIKKYKIADNSYYTTYSYKTKKGLVTQCVVKGYDDGEKVSSIKYTFNYTKKAIKKKRYSMMINAFTNDERFSYLFIWY